ncbi:UGSC family (seleno)protein, partial [Geodermatophilus sp. CPCC 206100]|uniref:UGSC family (seleno)protein n=1 Tax=Geodermatophilus sp. CPCC 206100 TaxID=3020054 RepID=UPI003B00359B
APGYRYAVVPHPVSSLDPKGVRAAAELAAPQVLEILRGEAWPTWGGRSRPWTPPPRSGGALEGARPPPPPARPLPGGAGPAWFGRAPAVASEGGRICGVGRRAHPRSAPP